MNLSGDFLFKALAYITTLPVHTRQWVIGRALLVAPLARWPRLLTHLRLAYGDETPEYSVATKVEQILRGIEVAA